MIKRFAILFGLLGLVALGLEQANPLILYPFDATEETPEQIALPEVEQHALDHAGQRLVLWSAPPAPGKPVIFYLHGNAGNLADRKGRFQSLTRSGFGIFAPAYPGSSGSTGKASERAILAAVRHAYETLHLRQDFPEMAGPVVVYGESLGAAVAIALMDDLAQNPNPNLQAPRGVVLEAPFASVAQMADAHIQGLGGVASLFMDSWASDSRAARTLTQPLVVLHGARDLVVPVEQGQAVFDAAASAKKTMYRLTDSGHVDIWASGILTRLYGRMAAHDLGM